MVEGGFTPEQVRRVKVGFSIVMALILVGLIPIFWVQDQYAYLLAWLSFLLIYLTTALISVGKMTGRISRGKARLLVYVVSVSVMALFGAALWLRRT